MTDGSPDTFTRDRLLWQEQVLADRGMTLLALHVALVIGRHINRQSGEAWPSQETIASALSVTPEGVRKAVRQLVDNGHLTVAVRHGRGDSNRYRLAFKTPTVVPVSAPENPNGRSGIGQGNPNGRSEKTPTVVPPNSMRELSEGENLFPALDARSKPRQRAAKAKTSDAQFDDFWLQVPKAKGKADARRAYDKAILSGTVTHHEIMIGITRYAAERQGQDEQFTKHPATWLNKGCWADAPARTNGGQQQPSRHSRRLDPEAHLQRRLEEIGDD